MTQITVTNIAPMPTPGLSWLAGTDALKLMKMTKPRRAAPTTIDQARYPQARRWPSDDPKTTVEMTAAPPKQLPKMISVVAGT